MPVTGSPTTLGQSAVAIRRLTNCAPLPCPRRAEEISVLCDTCFFTDSFDWNQDIEAWSDQLRVRATRAAGLSRASPPARTARRGGGGVVRILLTKKATLFRQSGRRRASSGSQARGGGQETSLMHMAAALCGGGNRNVQLDHLAVLTPSKSVHRRGDLGDRPSACRSIFRGSGDLPSQHGDAGRWAGTGRTTADVATVSMLQGSDSMILMFLE